MFAGTLAVMRKEEFTSKKIKNVMKIGRTTNQTEGSLILKNGILSVSFFKTPHYDVNCIFKRPYVVRDINKEPFFKKGDSGSGVFVLREENLPKKALGIAFGMSLKSPFTFFCMIDEILDELDLTLVSNNK